MRFSRLIILIVIIGIAALIAWKKGYLGQAHQALDESFSVHMGNGKRLYQETRYEEAIAELERAIELDPNHPDMPRALRCLGDCYKELRQPEKAVEVYREILEKYPDDKMRGDVEKTIMKVEELGYY